MDLIYDQNSTDRSAAWVHYFDCEARKHDQYDDKIVDEKCIHRKQHEPRLDLDVH